MNTLLEQFKQMQKIMKTRGKDRGKGLKLPFGRGLSPVNPHNQERTWQLGFACVASAARSSRCTASWSPTRKSPRDGRFIEIIGTYNPKGATLADKVQVDADKARQWISKGATPSETVQSLLKQAGVFKAATV